MKYLALIAITLLMVGVAYADSTAVVPTNVTVSADLGPRAESVLRDLAEQVGVGTEALYPLYLKQADVFADMCLMVCIIWAVVVIALYIMGRLTRPGNDARFPLMVLATVGAMVLFVGVVTMVGDYVTARSNPELWAIQHIAKDAAQLLMQ